jgi:hypothetical protein
MKLLAELLPISPLAILLAVEVASSSWPAMSHASAAHRALDRRYAEAPARDGVPAPPQRPPQGEAHAEGLGELPASDGRPGGSYRALPTSLPNLGSDQ